ncbi:hypothetical protein EVA_11225 [gut metagenome]|uniref:Calcineurin-like phosphoesterase domain-containing protein n=1 Tax=gut metagenome TaxID=749906 RepID=J9G1F4_9ZZZZ
MHRFRTKEYELTTEKLKSGESLKFVVLTDLHGLVYGEENEELIHAVKKANPDVVLSLGDLVVPFPAGNPGCGRDSDEGACQGISRVLRSGKP